VAVARLVWFSGGLKAMEFVCLLGYRMKSKPTDVLHFLARSGDYFKTSELILYMYLEVARTAVLTVI
jgi:hypothetical protein